MRLVLYTLATDLRRANGIAATPTDVFQRFENNPAPGTVIKMSFVLSPGAVGIYVLDEGTRTALAATVGLLSTYDEIVIMMHASASRLSVQGATNQAGAQIATGRWSLADARTILSACAPTKLFFMCCQFGKVRVATPANPVTDGVTYIAQQMPTGTKLLAMNENVMAIAGMPVLRETFYTRRVTA